MADIHPRLSLVQVTAKCSPTMGAEVRQRKNNNLLQKEWERKAPRTFARRTFSLAAADPQVNWNDCLQADTDRKRPENRSDKIIMYDEAVQENKSLLCNILTLTHFGVINQALVHPPPIC